MAGRPPSGFRVGTGIGGRAPLGTGMCWNVLILEILILKVMILSIQV